MSVYLGSFKFRDGVMGNMTGNLMVQSSPAFQVTGFDTNFWVDNTVVSSGVSKICAPDNTAALTGTTYAVLKASPSPPSPSPYPGWEPTYCQSCEHNVQLKEMGKNYSSIVDCMSACGYEDGCKFINYAETTDHHCVLYGECSPPITVDNCDASRHDWWTTWEKTEDAYAVAAPSLDLEGDLGAEGDCLTKICTCDDGTQEDITEADLAQLIQDSEFRCKVV